MFNFNSLSVFAVVVSAFSASSAFAYDFGSADAAFAKRTDTASAATARSLYSDALASVSGAERVYALEQLARIEYYEGNKTPESDAAGRKTIFKRCMDTADKFDNSTVQHAYWRGLCLASWARANGVLKSLEKAGEILALVEKGRVADETYEGGGAYRLGAAVYLNLPPLFGGDIEKAWSYAQKAISSPAFKGAKNPDTETGSYFYAAYLYAAQIAAKREGKAAAQAILQEAIERIDGGDLPVEREPETLINRQELADYLATLD